MSKKLSLKCRKLIGLFTAVILTIGLVYSPNIMDANAQNSNMAQAIAGASASVTATANRDIQDGVTLHCWNWSFNNIKANMATIAAQGYTAIQTSPIQQAKEGTKGYGVDGWWVYYQPANFTIDNTGNSALGTKAEFKSMCDEAEKYGIKVIVDVVANHLGNQTGNNLSNAIPSEIRNNANYWHDYTKNTNNYNSRYEVTQYCMAGLPDLNTANKDIQNYVITFLKECIDAGADGFRFDAAKHIEVPDDTDYCASDFWPTVVNAANTYASSKGLDLYIYGELLDVPGGTTQVSSYTEYMSVTDNQWSNGVRSNIESGHAEYISYAYAKESATVKPNQLVLWAESHDTYANAGGETRGVSTSIINKTWAFIAARADAMSLYYARPSNMNTAKLGDAGITGWSYNEVKAVNLFHNAFVDKGEYVSNENGIAYVERGTSGVVLVNCAGTSTSVNVAAHVMADGTYKDQITGNTFTVSGGRIKGQMGNTGIAVVYNAVEEDEPSTEKNIAYIKLPSGWSTDVYCYAYNLATDSGSNAEWPGVKMTKVSGRIYKYEVPSSIKNPGVIFYSSDTYRFPGDGAPGLPLSGSMIYEDGVWKTYETETTTSQKETTTTKKNETQTTTKKQESETTTKKTETQTTTKKTETQTTTKKQESQTTTKKNETQTTTKKTETQTTTKKGSEDTTTTKGSNIETTTAGGEETTTKNNVTDQTTTKGSGEATTTKGSSDDTTTTKEASGEDPDVTEDETTTALGEEDMSTSEDGNEANSTEKIEGADGTDDKDEGLPTAAKVMLALAGVVLFGSGVGVGILAWKKRGRY